MFAPYPHESIKKQIPNGQWEVLVSSWKALLNESINGKNVTDSLETFLASYVKESALESSKDEELRKAVLVTITQLNVPRNPSAEFVWNFFNLYLSKNYHLLTKYLNNIKAVGSKSFVNGLSRMYLTVKQDNTILEGLLSNSTLAAALVTSSWIKSLDQLYAKEHSEDLLRAAALSLIYAKKSFSDFANCTILTDLKNSAFARFVEVTQLIEMFPSLERSRAVQLVESYGSIDSTVAALLENPSLGETVAPVKPESSAPSHDSIKNARFGKKALRLGERNKSLQKTLELLAQTEEDERDDTYDEAEVSNSTDHSVVDKATEYVWSVYTRDRSVFDRSARKLKMRQDMKKETKWSDEQIEGWARMIQKSPGYARSIEDRLMEHYGRHVVPTAFQFSKSYRSENDDSESELALPNSRNLQSSRNTRATGTAHIADSDVSKVASDTSKDEIEAAEQPSKVQPSRKTKSPSNSGALESKTEQQKSKEQVARERRRKEQNKGKAGNHNRKSGHDKKAARMGATL